MQTMIVETLAGPGLSQTNPGGNVAASSTAPTRVPQLLSPNMTPLANGIQALGDGVIPMGVGGAMSPNNLLLIPYGAGTGATPTLYVYGWSPTIIGTGAPLWIPILLATYALTYGTSHGVVGSDIGATTQLFCTTVTCTGGPTFVTSGAAPVSLDWLQISGSSATIAMICVRSFGFSYLECVWTTASGVTANALYRKF